jgi:hypothetical protein
LVGDAGVPGSTFKITDHTLGAPPTRAEPETKHTQSLAIPGQDRHHRPLDSHGHCGVKRLPDDPPSIDASSSMLSMLPLRARLNRLLRR